MGSKIRFAVTAEEYSLCLTVSSHFNRTSSVNSDNTLAESSISNNDSSFESSINRYHSIMNTDSSNIKKALTAMKSTDRTVKNKASTIGR